MSLPVKEKLSVVVVVDVRLVVRDTVEAEHVVAPPNEKLPLGQAVHDP